MGGQGLNTETILLDVPGAKQMEHTPFCTFAEEL